MNRTNKTSARKRPARKMTNRERKARIVEHLKPMQGRSVYNKNIQQPVKFTRKGIDEISQHGQYSNFGMSAAMDAPNQVRKSVKQYESKAKKNQKQRSMSLKAMITMKGNYKGKTTKVNIGKTANGVHKVYSVTIPKRKKRVFSVSSSIT